ncbi:hypothetical protein V6S06_13460 [Aeromonas hydrophila]|nr:hypothetical protein [Aeromonas hydrophila]
MSTGKKKYIAKTQANKNGEVKKSEVVNKPMAKGMKATVQQTSQRAAKKRESINAPKPPGYTESKGGLYVPDDGSSSYVATGKLQAGIESAKEQIKGTLKNIASLFTQDFEVSEIELSVTFSADGKFLGFGTGGAMSAKVKIRPSND